MTREETVKILYAITEAFPTFKINDINKKVAFWHEILKDDNYNRISKGLVAYIRDDKTGFAPSIGQLINCANQVTQPQELTAVEAWGLVMAAVRNSTYNALQEFAKLPPTVQEALGSPNVLREWGMDDDFNESVAMSHFRESYNIVAKRQGFKKNMSPELSQLIETVNKGIEERQTIKCKGDDVECLESVNTQATRVFVPMPDDVKERIKEKWQTYLK